MENHHLEWILPLEMVMFHSYQEGILTVLISHDMPISIPWKSVISRYIPMLYQWYPINYLINMHSIPMIVLIVYEYSHGTGSFIVYNSPIWKTYIYIIWVCPHRKPPQKISPWWLLFPDIPWNIIPMIFPWNIPSNPFYTIISQKNIQVSSHYYMIPSISIDDMV